MSAPRAPGRPPPVYTAPVADPPSPAVARARALARVLDTAFRVPGTNFRVGLDPILGLVPGAGDVLGGVLSTYVLLLAAQAGASKPVLLRMLGNVGVDVLVGTVPLLGDLFDAGFKANARNVALLERFLEEPRRTERASTGFVALLVGAALLLVVGAITLAVVVVRALAGALG